VVLVGDGILDDPDSILAAAVVDAVLVVAKSGRTGRQDLARTREEIERAGGRLVGAVLLR
jgi:Mrp family chromosome partitioning ATPase